jgi:hypothetical protein
MEWKFLDSMDTAVLADIQCLKFSQPIIYVSHDTSDGMWQFIGPDFNGDSSRAMLVSLSSIVQSDSSVEELFDLPPGWIAKRKSRNHPWRRSPHPLLSVE